MFHQNDQNNDGKEHCGFYLFYLLTWFIQAKAQTKRDANHRKF
jgi:hypothetical protein